MYKLAPSILSADFSKLGEEALACEKAGAELIHIDVMDGHFVPNITIGAPVVKSLRKIEGIFLDTHLMITNPEKYADDFILAGSDLITFHVEATEESTLDLIKYIKNKGVKAGLSIKPKTPAEVIEKYIQYFRIYRCNFLQQVNLHQVPCKFYQFLCLFRHQPVKLNFYYIFL